MFFPLPRRGRGKKHGFSSEPFMARRKRSSAVENRLRFSTAEVEKKNRRFFFSRKERSSIFLSSNRKERQDFFPEPFMAKIFLPSHIWLGEKNGFSSDFDTFSSSDISPDSGSPQIPKESEGTAVPPISKKSEGKARFFSRAIYGSKKKTRVRGKPVLFLKEKGPGRGKNSPFFRRKKGPEIRGNNGSLRASIEDRCPEKTREKNASSGKTRPFSERKRTRNSKKYRSRRKSVLFLSEKGPGEKTNPRFFLLCPPKIP